MSRLPEFLLISALLATSSQAGPLGLGREALPEEVAAWNTDVMPDGSGLPEGSGDVETGEVLFIEHCAACHGDFAEGLGNWPPLTGGEDTLNEKDPLKTVGSYWPYLSTVWDYVHRSMPFGQAQILTADETYAITAYILYSNYLVEDDFMLSSKNFNEVSLPNVDGFIVDDRPETEYPEFSAEPCMTDCKDKVEITLRASDLNVTPGQDAAPPGQQSSAVSELVAKGKKLFAKCKSCHMIGEGAENRAGPVLNGIIGRPAGSYDGYKYSPAMEESEVIWTAETLSGFLQDPKGIIPKNKMSFPGLRKPEEVEALIAYLDEHS